MKSTKKLILLMLQIKNIYLEIIKILDMIPTLNIKNKWWFLNAAYFLADLFFII